MQDSSAARILRAFRFAARLQFSLARSTAKAVESQKHLIRDIDEVQFRSTHIASSGMTYPLLFAALVYGRSLWGPCQ